MAKVYNTYPHGTYMHTQKHIHMATYRLRIPVLVDYGFTLRPHVAISTSLKVLSPNAVRLKFRLQIVNEGVEDTTQSMIHVKVHRNWLEGHQLTT